MAVLTLKNVKKEYYVGEITIPAVEDVSFELNEGEFVVILGASGAGKTTLLNLLGGMDRATSGEIVIDDKNITKFNKKELANYRRKKLNFKVVAITGSSGKTTTKELVASALSEKFKTIASEID